MIHSFQVGICPRKMREYFYKRSVKRVYNGSVYNGQEGKQPVSICWRMDTLTAGLPRRGLFNGQKQ